MSSLAIYPTNINAILPLRQLCNRPLTSHQMFSSCTEQGGGWKLAARTEPHPSPLCTCGVTWLFLANGSDVEVKVICHNCCNKVKWCECLFTVFLPQQGGLWRMTKPQDENIWEPTFLHGVKTTFWVVVPTPELLPRQEISLNHVKSMKC